MFYIVIVQQESMWMSLSKLLSLKVSRKQAENAVKRIYAIHSPLFEKKSLKKSFTTCRLIRA